MDNKYKIIEGDCIAGMCTLPDESVHCVVTSPPYYGLRDYGVDGQIGLEESPEAYVERLVDVFREVRRILRNDGTLWLNLGDTYAGGGSIGRNETTPEALARRAEMYGTGTGSGSAVGNQGTRARVALLKPKDLIGIPWRVAFALQADGWYLRQDIIWHKLNPMPEPAKDRCVKGHEYIFLLAKSEKYYFDFKAIQEDAVSAKDLGILRSKTLGNPSVLRNDQKSITQRRLALNNDTQSAGSGKRNKRTVWGVANQPYAGAHFATFPEKLIEPCILAGCPADGIVFDPFTGSGTTAVVALKNGKNFIGTEINPEYITLAHERIQKSLNKKD